MIGFCGVETGVGVAGLRVRTEEGGPEWVCVQARIVGAVGGEVDSTIAIDQQILDIFTMCDVVQVDGEHIFPEEVRI